MRKSRRTVHLHKLNSKDLNLRRSVLNDVAAAIAVSGSPKMVSRRAMSSSPNSTCIIALLSWGGMGLP